MPNIKIDMMVSETSQERLEQSAVFIHPTMHAEVINYVNAMTQVSEDEIPSSPRECCIYKVPHTIRDLNADAYTPKVVSIGPFHNGNEKLKGMERHKRIFLKNLLQESGRRLEDLVRYVMRWERRVRACYFDEIKLDQKEFVTLILVDAAFIIELFRIFQTKSRKEKVHKDEISKDKKKLQPWSLDGATKDLILLENQLPFFVIEGMFNEAFPTATSEENSKDKISSFRELTFSFFSSYTEITPRTDQIGEIKHFTDLLRSFFLSSGTKTTDERGKLLSFMKSPRDLLLYSATELQEAGVKLKASTRREKSLLDLKFTSPVLEIPEIFLEDRTEILFRNMIALEQCHHHFECHITEYAFVLDCLINAHKDVDALTHKKIIHNFLGDVNDVANLFNGLRKNIIGEYISSDYHDICQELNEYCRRSWNKRMANLRRDYCKTAWHTMASAAAIVVILLTLIQTILSALQIVLGK